jgi:hypothetical protein
MTTDIPEGLVSYLATMDRYRAQQVDAALEARTSDELALMKEAAVMAYVQGMQAGRDVPIPKDSALLRMVVGACLAMPDLYPTISRSPGDAEEATDG